MRIIPVIDLKQGAVVRGMAGRREQYRPIISSLALGHAPAEIAAALVRKFEATTVYVADLDAIESGQPDPTAWRAIADAGLDLWLDAGVGSQQRARFVGETLARVNGGGAIVVGLESLSSSAVLHEIGDVVGNSTVFSLDLREGHPLARSPEDQSLSADDWAERAVAAGFQRMIVLDLADVGVGRGTGTLELCRTLRARFPQLELVAGGGIRHRDDLRALAAAGCDAALVASALHDGRITTDDWVACAAM